MNLNLAHQLLLGSALSERCLGYDLGSAHSLVVKIGKLIALSEPSFSKEPSSLVLLDVDVSIVLDYFLLDDDILLVYRFF